MDDKYVDDALDSIKDDFGIEEEAVDIHIPVRSDNVLAEIGKVEEAKFDFMVAIKKTFEEIAELKSDLENTRIRMAMLQTFGNKINDVSRDLNERIFQLEGIQKEFLREELLDSESAMVQDATIQNQDLAKNKMMSVPKIMTTLDTLQEIPKEEKKEIEVQVTEEAKKMIEEKEKKEKEKKEENKNEGNAEANKETPEG